MMETWSQREDSSDNESENEFANMCFMDFEYQDKVNSNSNSDSSLMKTTPHLRRKFLSYKRT